ncbi:flagellar hook-associated protein FlgL [Arthrobacter sp. A5]|uniref:flagellar hook-associated protein FlgL n=1 Tax=Arthrobacter sp. A5 TaxID=576926 RepID=UPI003DA98452
MISRVTNQTMMDSAQRNLQSSSSQLAKLQDRASTLKAIGRPSDDPAAAAAALQVRAQQSATDQYGRNIENGNGWLATVDTTMSSASFILNRVRDLTVQGANGGVSSGAKEALAVEITGLKTDLLSQANTKFMSRNIFAGNSNDSSPFSSTAPYTVPAGGAVERRVGNETSIRVDADGAAVFGTGDTSVFALLDKITADLTSGADVSAHLKDLEARMTAISSRHAEVGTRQAQLLRAQETNTALKGTLEATRSGIEDLDLGKAILDLQLQATNYQAALAVTAKVLPMSLMDFLR